MKEIQAENPIEIEDVVGGVVLTIPGEAPPLFGFIVLLIMAMLFMISWVTAPIGIALVLLAVFGYKKHKQSQVIKLIDGKLMTKKQSFDITKISSFEFSNVFDSTNVSSSSGGVWLASGPAGISAAAIGGAVSGATVGLTNAILKSGAKKGFMVKIVYGTKKYDIAVAMREIRARALFAALTGK